MKALNSELIHLQKKGTYRRLRRLDGAQTARTVIEGKECILLSSNNYLGLTDHPEVKEAARRAIDLWGTGAGGSRLTTGNYALHEELEKEIARFKRVEEAIVFGSGYAANVGVIQSLVGRGDVVFSDELNHASIIDGIRLSRAEVRIYKHKDMSNLEELMEKTQGYKRSLVITDGVFSMDGDLAPLKDIVCLAKRYGSWVMVDDAHGTGVLGRRGAGTVEHFGLEGRVHIQLGTLSKSLGSSGAYVAGRRELVDYLRNTARSFIFSTAPPPAAVGAALAAMRVMEREPEIRARLWENTNYLRTGLEHMGYRVIAGESPIIPILIGDSEKTTLLAQALYEKGIYAPGIRPPTVPWGTSRIRVTVMATHSVKDLDRALEVFSLEGSRAGII